MTLKPDSPPDQSIRRAIGGKNRFVDSGPKMPKMSAGGPLDFRGTLKRF